MPHKSEERLLSELRRAPVPERPADRERPGGARGAPPLQPAPHAEPHPPRDGPLLQPAAPALPAVPLQCVSRPRHVLPAPCFTAHWHINRIQGSLGEQLSPWPEETCLPLPKVNLGPEFQAEVPQLLECRSHDHWPEESPMEQLLWKPWEDLEDSNDLQDQVENLLDLCSSSAMPGGGTNLELALHCLSRCQGDMLATVEMLLLSSPPSSSSSSSSSGLPLLW
ncbi:hypothetical protein COCON_G00041340 [Conger conger]|uniref:ELM2 domain-containing protein n=1 Tax=Conger conger TaxID=82655 RepID=A0A9Q1DTM4_CONCO|nr:hypothetical protein COCON_G00041340 [Conger conger]